MSAKIPSRYGFSIPKETVTDLSTFAGASHCFVHQRFNRNLQRFLIDYSLSIGSSPMLQTDYPDVKYWKEEDFLPEAVKPVSNLSAADAVDVTIPLSNPVSMVLPTVTFDTAKPVSMVLPTVTFDVAKTIDTGTMEVKSKEVVSKVATETKKSTQEVRNDFRSVEFHWGSFVNDAGEIISVIYGADYSAKDKVYVAYSRRLHVIEEDLLRFYMLSDPSRARAINKAALFHCGAYQQGTLHPILGAMAVTTGAPGETLDSVKSKHEAKGGIKQ